MKKKCELCKEKEIKVAIFLAKREDMVMVCDECDLNISLQMGFLEDDEVDKLLDFKYCEKLKEEGK